MNKSKLKSYAPQARKDFIAMVQSRAAQLGIAEVNGQLQVQPCEVQGQVAIIAGQAFPAKIANKRQALVARMQKEGFAATVDAIAYTWFNRFAALRYMELQNYLGHGQRVLSSMVEGGLPDILTHALELVSAGDLPGVSVDDVSQLKLAGKDGELYKRLLVAQCNQLAGRMGFLFERIDDDSELLLPDNLLRTDSVVRKLVDSIDEADWQQVEIIGWLYQFYISEKKDQVIGKVVKSADIPAATQLFTPNWIVKYLVQNSVGRLWLQANPGSALASQMAYYIQPAEQTPEVNAQLGALVQARIAEDGDTLNPESITVLDPACGSGHILVEAYDLLKAIYLERGYRERDIPRLILQKNLFGLDIDDRAAQLAAFALLMKARADDRRLFNEPVQLNVMALQESAELDAEQLMQDLALRDASEQDALETLLDTFEQAKTFGSLLRIPEALEQALPQLAARIAAAQASGDLYAQSAAATLRPLLQQAQLLARQYDAVVANPPYMGGLKGSLKDFATEKYPQSKLDLYSMFIERGLTMASQNGYLSYVTMQSWMFLSSYEDLRRLVLREKTIGGLAHLGPHAFEEIPGERVQVCCFFLIGCKIDGFYAKFHRLISGNAENKRAALLARENEFGRVNQDIFLKLSDASIAYKISENEFLAKILTSGEIVRPNSKIGSQPGSELIIYWWEVDDSKIGSFWRMYNKGGQFRKWYGNQFWVLKYGESGEQVSAHGGQLSNSAFYFKPHISWTRVSSKLNLRYYPAGFGFDNTSPAIFDDMFYLVGYFNSVVGEYNRTIKFSGTKIESGHVESIAPCNFPLIRDEIDESSRRLVAIHKVDWDLQGVSRDFCSDAIVTIGGQYIQLAWLRSKELADQRVAESKLLEEKNNKNFIDSYGLSDDLTCEVPENQITLTRADREKDMQRLVSYAISCMMGRYSLDEPGLIYAHAGNVGFDPSRYVRFAADADGIVPVSDLPWFLDDATQRVKEFLVAVWGQDTLAENLAWLADSLGRKADESPEDALRRYISGSFFKDHCQTYKKRPIYWLFSSGNQKAFEALVYLHRYNESTLARMRAEYVVPLTGRMAERITRLEEDSLKATTSVAKKTLDKQIDKLKKKLEELRLYDEKLRHFADQRITLNLDDGVKVNYGKFGDLLDNVKAITGGAGDD